MPHIKLEYSLDVDSSLIDKIFDKIKDVLTHNTSIKEKNCKLKAILDSNYENINFHYVHLEISILEGRSPQIIKLIGESSLKIIKKYFILKNFVNIQYSVELREIKKLNYFTINKI